jgi:hypothetical protein
MFFKARRFRQPTLLSAFWFALVPRRVLATVANGKKTNRRKSKKKKKKKKKERNGGHGAAAKKVGHRSAQARAGRRA